jgi:hypothetical protein
LISLLSAPTPWRVFRDGPANNWVTTEPYIWLPTVMVAFAILGHIVIYRRLRDNGGQILFQQESVPPVLPSSL